MRVEKSERFQCEGGDLNPYAIAGASTSRQRCSEKSQENHKASEKCNAKKSQETPRGVRIRSAFGQQALAALFSGFALIACGTPDDKILHGDTRFTDSERAAIIEGEAWLATQAGHEPFGVVFDMDDPSAYGRKVVKGHAPGSSATGLCEPGEGLLLTIHLATEGQPIEWVPGLMAHEMAHCRYGFVDAYREGDPPTDGIMRIVYPMRWTDAEEAQCERTNCREECK